MNNHFEIENHRLVGYVDFRPGKQSGDYNASIVVLGFIDEHFVVHKFATGEAKKLFPPKGTVFAPNFDQKILSFLFCPLQSKHYYFLIQLLYFHHNHIISHLFFV